MAVSYRAAETGRRKEQKCQSATELMRKGEKRTEVTVSNIAAEIGGEKNRGDSPLQS